MACDMDTFKATLMTIPCGSLKIIRVEEVLVVSHRTLGWSGSFVLIRITSAIPADQLGLKAGLSAGVDFPLFGRIFIGLSQLFDMMMRWAKSLLNVVIVVNAVVIDNVMDFLLLLETLL
ncbi:hypothetical protein ACLOJK_004058 [Asimina triloba]